MAKPISEEHGSRIAHQERGAQLQGDSEGRLDADRFTWLSINPSLLGASGSRWRNGPWGHVRGQSTSKAGGEHIAARQR
jgi:hypothetical protein